MPVLDISDGNGNLNPDAGALTGSIMLYPSEEPEQIEARMDALRLTFFTELSERRDEEGGINLQPRDIQNLIQLNAESAAGEILRRFQEGTIAGKILLGIAILARDAPGMASVNKLVSFICYQHAEISNRLTVEDTIPQHGQDRPLKRKDGPKQSRMPFTNTSETAIREYWSKFKPVAHLCAARILHNEHQVSMFGAPVENSTRDDKKVILGIPAFLSDAECLRAFGEQHYSRGQKKHNNSTLDPQTSWKVPGDLSLPSSRLAVNLPNWDDLVEMVRKDYTY